MIRYLWILIVFSLSTLHAQNDNTNDNTYENVNIWYGPGWYNGIWFANEDDFNNWNEHHYHDYNHQHMNGGQDHRPEDDRGGRGGHGGGGHR